MGSDIVEDELNDHVPTIGGETLEAISKIVDESKAMNNGRLTMEERRVLISSPCMSSFDIQNDGLHGRPVGSGQEPALTYSGEDRDAWQEAARCSGSVQWGVMDLPDGSPMAGPAAALSALPIVPSVLPALVSGGRMGQGTLGVGAGPQTTREDRYH